MEIDADGYQSKVRSNRAKGRDVTFPGGRKLFVIGGHGPADRSGRAAR